MAIKLREYQEDVKTRIYRAWEAGHKNVLLVKPTGMGKTKTFCSIAIDKAILPLIEKLPTAILVHRKELVQQISLTLAEEGILHNIIAPRPVIQQIIASQRIWLKKTFYDYNAMVTVISVDTLNSRISTHEEWARKIRLWITDEAAHLLANNKWGKSVSFFPNAIGLGVTATPQRLDKRGLGRHADGVFDVMVQGPTTKWGIENGYLCKYKIAVPQSDYRNYLRKASGDSDYTREAMALASSQSRIIGDVVTNYQKFANGKQAILFATDIATGEKMEKSFRDAGITAKLLTSDTDPKDRLQSLLDYRDKKIKVLLNVDLFDEGLDVPGIECVIMARPTMSLSKYLQMIGRGLRPAPGKAFLIVIDHVGNVPEHGLPDLHRRWTLDRITRRGDRTNLIRICSHVECNAPYDRALSECPYCGTPPFRGSRGESTPRPGPEMVDGDMELLDPETVQKMYADTILEDPLETGKRVSKAAGGPAGIRAMKKQQERIDTQKNLVDVIALWAGKIKHQGYGDRYINKQFYLLFDRTITEALVQPREAMLDLINEISGHIRFGGYDETRERSTAGVTN